MADKVDSNLEKMVDELAYYKEEALFSQKELTRIVKQRRADEYSMVRKDADISFFLDAIKYERDLEQLKIKRIKRQRKAAKEAGIQKKPTQFREENCIHRRVIHIY
jgi:U3 small nucleolar RNA-associated protein 6